MKIRAIALNTLATLVRNKLIALICAVFLCVVLLMMSPLLMMKTMAKTSPEAAETTLMGLVSVIVSMVSGFGSLLAAWSAAESVAGEIRSGTILAILARPVRRWEFLLGKFLGVQLLMLIYAAFMLAVAYMLVGIGGGRIHAAPWLLVVYPIVRWAVYSAIAMALVTVMHPVLAFGTVLVVSVVCPLAAPGSNGLPFLPEWLRSAFYAVLPSTTLLSEARFLELTQANLKSVPWTNHVIALAYGLDYALVLFLVAVWSFRRRGLARE